MTNITAWFPNKYKISETIEWWPINWSFKKNVGLLKPAEGETLEKCILCLLFLDYVKYFSKEEIYKNNETKKLLFKTFLDTKLIIFIDNCFNWINAAWITENKLKGSVRVLSSHRVIKRRGEA